MEEQVDKYWRMPKLELHAHLNGSISTSTMKKLLDRYSHMVSGSFPDLDEWRTTISKGSTRTLNECFEMFKIIHCVVCDEAAVSMVAHDVVCEFAAENVIYLELRSTPRSNSNTGMTKVKYVEALLKGVKLALSECNFSIEVRLLLSIDRSGSPADALDTVELAKQYTNCAPCNVVGIDLSGNPKVGDINALLPALRYAKESGLKLAIHLSEIPNANQETSLLLTLPPDRIGHGTFMLPSEGGAEEIVETVSSNKIPLELCLTSNVKSQTVRSYDQHHFGFWAKRSHPLILCTDDKGIFSTSLSDEYRIAAQCFSLSVGDMQELARSAVEYIFDESTKLKLWQTIDSYRQTLS